jgi:hypothetical protein
MTPGAIVPAVRIAIHNIPTSAAHTITADESGRWREPALQPGDYEIRVSAAGFQTVLRKDVQLAVGQEAIIDMHLELGNTSTEVSVSREALAVNLVSGAVSGLVDHRQMRDLPLNGRSFQQLALPQAGRQRRQYGRQRSGRRPHPQNLDQWNAAGAEQFPARRH